MINKKIWWGAATLISIFLYYLISSDSNHEPKPISVADKKAAFHQIILPAINKVFNERMMLYREINALKMPESNAKIQLLLKKYNAANIEELKQRIYPHPKSIAIAQAAMESAWGTSRFAREARNYFGVWSFSKKDNRIAANKKRGSKTIWLKKYSSVAESVRDYYDLLGNKNVYSEFNRQKLLSSNPLELVKYLDSYSEQGAKYGDELIKIINYNGYEALDSNL